MAVEMDIRLHVLEKITKNFSVDLRIGRGGYGDVYKGVLCDQELIAVKLLHDSVERLDDELFKNEVGNLLTVEHPNIVQFLGYCYETQSKYVKYNGQNRFSKHIHRVLCFEYLQGGSLDKRLHEQSLGPTWSTHYNIIKGICEGLNFLHGHEPQILHLDLKPANILLDSSMTPKVADFGLSRLFGGSHTHVTRKMIGTEKYMSPDSINECIISPKNDIFSLGVVIIEIMAGPTGYSDFQEDVPKFRREVLNKWNNIIEPTMNYRPQLLLQVKTCIDTAIRCVDPQRENRPTIASILYILNEIETDIPNTQLAVMPPSRTIDIKNSLAETLKKMTANPDNITNLVTNMEQVPNIRESSSNVEEPSIIEESEDRETSSYVEEGLIIGRSEEKNEILSILSESSTKKMVILPIYGIGGIGKTTLAQLVFNDTRFSGHSRVWLYVSEQLDLYNIGNCIISQLSKEISNITNMQIIHNRIGELFADKRIIIVLDDLWEKDAQKLDKLKEMLSVGKGSKVILVTTRDEAIARSICSTIKNVKYKLEILSDDKCWAILKQKSDFENQADKTFLEQVGRSIATKCGGVALAAQSLGYMLRSMTSDQWESVRDSDIWNLSTSEDPSITTHKVLASLRLSYSHMPEFLKLCFSYCAIFPKGHLIAKSDLVYQWIALKIKPSGTFDSMQLCQQYVRQLLGMSFLQYAKTPLDGCQDEYNTLFRMHDLVHDLARAMLANTFNKNVNVVGSSSQYEFLTCPSRSLLPPVNSPENLKALHSHRTVVVHEDASSPAKCLLVLDLSGNFFQNLPVSIGQLKQLKYLHAPRIQDQMIPTCISELTKLNYLSLRDSHYIKALPDSIGDIKGLMYLDLSGCWSIGELPVSLIELKQLVHLDLSNCYLPVAEALGSLNKLQDPKLFPRHSPTLVLPERIVISNKEVIKVLPAVICKQTKLRYLNISQCKHVMALSEADIYCLLDSIGTLSNLEHLDLSWNMGLNSIPESISNLTKLHTLDISGCLIWRLPAWIQMNRRAGLKIVNARIVRLPKFVVYAFPSEGRSNLILLAPTNPEELEIISLEGVMSAEEAHSIRLIGKTRIKYLRLKWTLEGRFVDDKDVLENLVPPSSIGRLDISGYTSPSFPTNWLIGIGQYLPNVSEIVLDSFPKCNNLPPLGQLPNLEILRLDNMHSLEELNTTDSSGEVMFPKLHTLSIFYCPRLRIKPCLPRLLSTLSIDTSDNMLTAWGECVMQNSASYTSILTKLVVTRSMVPLYQWIRFLQHVSSLRHLGIFNCSDLTSCSPDDFQRLSYIESFALHDNILTELPTWLAEFTSLQDLSISLPMLKLNDNTRQLTPPQQPRSLFFSKWRKPRPLHRSMHIQQPLSLTNCMRMKSLPQWLGELTSIKKLHLKRLPGRITCLPGSIRRLTKLEHLCINDCTMELPLIRKLLSSISADTDEVDIQKLIEEYKKENEVNTEKSIEEYKKEQAKEDTARLKEISPFLKQKSASSESGSASTKPWELHMSKETVAEGNFTEDQATTTGIILPGKTKKYWVDKNGNNCFMLFPRGMSISWADKPGYWTWRPLEEGSDGGDVGIEVVELKEVCWLEIVGKQELSHLTPGVTYEVVFEVMLKQKSCGWEVAVDLRMNLPGGRDQNRKESLHGMHSLEWLQLKAGEVDAREGLKGELVVSLSEHNSWWKTGLIVKCIRITPKE